MASSLPDLWLKNKKAPNTAQRINRESQQGNTNESSDGRTGTAASGIRVASPGLKKYKDNNNYQANQERELRRVS